MSVLFSNNTRYGIPILYITQLMGLALGALPKEVGIHKLITSPTL